VACIRSIKPDFWTDEKIVELSFQARLLFIGLWNFADNAGRMYCSPRRLKMQIFPSDKIDVTPYLTELHRLTLVTLYSVNGHDLLQINGFTKHQKVDPRYESRLPSPPNTESHRDTPENTKNTASNGVEWSGNGNGDGVEHTAARRESLPAKPEVTTPGLDTEAWETWIKFRREIRKPVKPASIPAAQLELAAFGIDQRAVVQQSIAAGWQGLFPLKQHKRNSQNPMEGAI
jgi:hypothetical protein